MKRSFTFTLAGLIMLGMIVSVASAGVPQLMNYQGRLTDNGGNPLDTTVSVTFTIYDDSTGGNPKWTELHPAVTVTDGRPFALEGGGRLEEVVLAYESWGRLNEARSNAVLVCHALTGDSHAAGTIMPPNAAIAGSAAFFGSRNSPTTSSRLISSPTTKKKIAIKPSLIQ